MRDLLSLTQPGTRLCKHLIVSLLLAQTALLNAQTTATESQAEAAAPLPAACVSALRQKAKRAGHPFLIKPWQRSPHDLSCWNV
jgi:hypothetical protein